MMKILVFDTETTGFFNKKDARLEKQPYIIQFAGILGELDTNNTFTELERKDIFFKPPISIPYDSSQVHHIYDVDVRDADPISKKIDILMDFISETDVIIGHNIEFDEEMLKIELSRVQKLHLYKPNQVICTMKETVNYCALEGNGQRFKYPKLGELHKKLFGEYFIGAHDAMTDVEATLKCFLALEKKGIIQLKSPTQEVMSLF
ncbi:3'-5' exonuclease [Candidatus Gracilibacteria bacterium]|nr:3'-5' exonuclease [Candidatus Gracilibacteria bacterium]